MKTRFNKVLSGIAGVLMMLCIMGGILLMMCESSDWNTQLTTMLCGFGLFLLGAIPGIVISARGERVHG